MKNLMRNAARRLNLSHYLAPYEHRSENDLQAVEKVIANNDDSGAARCPALARTDGFDARRSWQRRIHA